MRALSSKRRGLTRNELLAATKLRSGGGATTILENLEEAGFISSALFHVKWLDASTKPKSWQGARRTPRWQAWAGLAREEARERRERLLR